MFAHAITDWIFTPQKVLKYYEKIPDQEVKILISRVKGDASFGEISVYAEVVTKPWSDDGGA